MTSPPVPYDFAVLHPASVLPSSSPQEALPTTSLTLQSTPIPPSLFSFPPPLYAASTRSTRADTLDRASRMRTFLPSDLGPQSTYKLLIGAVVPRPIAWVSTVSGGGAVNVAPMSFFQVAAGNPPTLSVSFTRKEGGGKKDSLRNIEETGEFVVNSVNEWNAEQCNDTSASFPYGVSEMEQAGLTPIPSLYIKPPRVGEAAISFECRLDRVVEIGDGTQPGNASMVLGTVLCIHCREEAITENLHVRIDQTRPIGRLGQSTTTWHPQSLHNTHPSHAFISP